MSLLSAGVGDFSVWEFSGNPVYHCSYDYFAANDNTAIHLVLFSLEEPYETQLSHVTYWLNLLKALTLPQDNIGEDGNDKFIGSFGFSPKENLWVQRHLMFRLTGCFGVCSNQMCFPGPLQLLEVASSSLWRSSSWRHTPTSLTSPELFLGSSLTTRRKCFSRKSGTGRVHGREAHRLATPPLWRFLLIDYRQLSLLCLQVRG